MISARLNAIKVAAGLAVAALVILLFAQARSIDPVEHSRVITNLSKLQQLNSELDEIVLKLRDALLNNYDPLVAAFDLIRWHKRDLELGDYAIAGRGEAEIDQAMAEFSRELGKKQALIEQFKSRNALLKNSFHYLPLSVETLSRDAGTPQAARARAQALLRDILLLRLGATPSDYEMVTLALARLRQEQDQQPSAVRATLEAVFRHAQNVIAHQEELDRLVRDITTADVRMAGKSFAEAYNRAFERDLKQANLYRLVLLLVSLGLVTYAAYSFLQLRKSELNLRKAADAQGREIAQRTRSEQALRESEERLRTIADNVPVLIGYVDAEERYRFANKAYEDWFGQPASAHIGRTLRESMGDEEYVQRKPDFEAALSGQTVNVERRTRSHVREQYAQFTFLPHRNAEGTVLGFYVIAYDVTERRKAAEALARERNLLLSIVDSLPDHVYVKGPDRGYLLINAVGRKLRGVASNKEVAGKTAFDFFPPQSAARFDAEDQAVMTTGLPLVNREHSTADASGERKWHLTSKVPLRGPSGEIIGLIGINRDITERRRAEEQLRLAASALENAAEGVMISDEHRRIAFVNKAFTRITGYAPSEAIGRDPDFLRSGEHDAAFYEAVWSEIRNAGGWQGEMWRRRKDGEMYPEWRSVSSVRDEAGQTTHFVSVFTDISQLKQDKARLEFLAHHDALTHLPNRTLFEDRLQEALNRAQRHAGKVGLLFIDLDRFKNINDSLGHGVGDLLLQAVTSRLKECVRKTDTVARLGGDEFAILLDELAESQHAVKVAEKLRAALAQPFKLGGHELVTSASIGISCYPDDGNDPQSLLKNADAAMYRAKESGRDTYRFFAAEMHTRALDLLVITNNLRVALERDELLLHYQPVIDLASGKVTALEALLRWQHPEFGMIPPVRFIPVAEDSGLIVPIGDWVLKQACAQMRAWEAKGIAPRRIAVNLSARQFKQKELARRIAAILDETGLAPQFLELEITESMVMQDPAEAEKVLRELHEMGIYLAIDDFGTGYSSLSYLKRFPIDFLKIDRSFVRDIPGSPDDVAITRAIVALAKSLDLSVIAEGVETEQQHAFLKAAGCEEAQGYLWSKPRSAEELEPLLQENALPLITAER